MDIEKYISLKDKQRQGKLSKDEQQAMQQWLQGAEGKALQKVDELADLYKKGYEPDVEAGLHRLKARMQAAKAQETQVKTLAVASRRRWLSAAAAVLILAVALVALRGWFPTKSEMLVVATDAKENRKLTLTDGTKVQLNTQSELTIPKSFENEAKRSVQLMGEAYFAVQPNEKQPFEIKTGIATITVLGTAFNVRAYPTEATTEVEVEQGRVEMRVGSQKIILLAKEKGIYNSQENKLEKRKTKQLNAQAWRTHRLAFQKEPLSEIIQELERYHRVRIEFANDTMKSCAFTCNFDETKLADALQVLQIGMQLQWEKTAANHYIIRGGKCP